MEKKDNVWLITLPHAGGSTALFRGWGKKINCKIMNIEYPGHWTRMKEQMLHTFDELVVDVLFNIINRLEVGDEVYIFGHSLGAIMAWQIAPKLLEKGIKVKGLILSASQNPGNFPEKVILEAITDEQLLKLVGYNALDNCESINEQFMRVFFPILKNDMEVCKSFKCDGHFVDIASIVCYGREDIFTDVNEMKKWSRYVRLNSMKEFPGEHLFIEEKDNIEVISMMINEMVWANDN